ncbi:MAG: type IV pilus modification protein PilV [Cocleimonas sp.]
MFKANKKQQGFSLIEVLVSLLILGVGMLGLGGLQVASIKGAENAHTRNIGNQLAFDMSDRMRANQDGSDAGFYENSVSCTTAGIPNCRRRGVTCSPQERADFDTQEILCGMKVGVHARSGGIGNSLLGGELDVSFQPANCVMANIPYNNAAYQIDITWDQRNLHQKQSGANNTQDQIVTVCVNP